MGLSTAQKNYILAQIKIKEEQLNLANSSFSELVNSTIEEYRIDSTEGDQRVRRKKMRDFEFIIESLESQIARLYAQLRGKTLVNMALRRKRGCPFGYRSF